jgi:flagellar hook assembly protein FlgD
MILRGGFWTLAPEVSSDFTSGAGEIFEDMLFQNSPNPFSQSTSLEYTVSHDGRVVVCVFDVTGKRVRTLVDESKSPGRYRVTWDGCDDGGEEVSPGIYFCRIEGDLHRSVKKMVTVK